MQEEALLKPARYKYPPRKCIISCVFRRRADRRVSSQRIAMQRDVGRTSHRPEWPISHIIIPPTLILQLPLRDLDISLSLDQFFKHSAYIYTPGSPPPPFSCHSIMRFVYPVTFGSPYITRKLQYTYLSGIGLLSGIATSGNLRMAFGGRRIMIQQKPESICGALVWNIEQ